MSILQQPHPPHAVPHGHGVSLRQCLLYLVIMTSSTDLAAYTAKNSFAIHEWVTDTNPKVNTSRLGSPYTSHLATASHAHIQRLADERLTSPSQKSLSNLERLKINKKSDTYPLTRNDDGTYTATITLNAEQILGLDIVRGCLILKSAKKYCILTWASRNPQRHLKGAHHHSNL